MAERKALITGASSGIGRVFSQRLAKEGFQTTSVARRKENLEDLISGLGNGHRYLVADLTEPDQLELVCQDIRENAYNLVINNAGYGLYGRFEDQPLHKLLHMMHLNIDGVVKLSHAFLKNARSGDALVNVSSALSILAFPGGAVYAGTKGFVTNFSESLWLEQKKKGIYVMALLPGVTKTEFHQIARGEGEEPPEAMSQTAEQVVEEAMRALKSRRKPVIVSGWKNRLFTSATRIMSRTRKIKTMGKFSPIKEDL